MNVTEVVAFPHGAADNTVASNNADAASARTPSRQQQFPSPPDSRFSRFNSVVVTPQDSSSSVRSTSTPPSYSTTTPTRQPRKPSPGLAARLKALGFGHKESSHRAHLASSPGRIPEDQIREIDRSHQLHSNPAVIPRRGRAWSGLTAKLEDHFLAGSGLEDLRSAKANPTMLTQDEGEDIDSQKYRMPEHTNGNGTKAMPDTRKAHIERETRQEDDVPPMLPPKDSPPLPTPVDDSSSDVQSYFNPFGLSRAGSIYTLSRASFASQLAQLTSLQLPDANSLSSKVSAIPTSQAACKVLMSAADQIRSWIFKASEVLDGLDADDDIEWAAIGGREGLEEVDACVRKFEDLINVYISAIEELQGRNDIGSVSTDDLTKTVAQMESILTEWEKIKENLRRTKDSVEMALEYEELCNVVLGDIGDEMDTLTRVVFEMEEKRHKSLMLEASGDAMDIGELETIVEDTPSARTRQTNRLSIQATVPMSPSSPGTPALTQDDSSLLALFARMQPLRASLDFLPMRLSSFIFRAEKVFPSACEELEARRQGLENSWKRLEQDADSLRRELGEDRWVLVFRGAGRQAQKMYESVERSMAKLREAIDSGTHLNNPASLGKKIESYEAKKMHYGPAIDRVLTIVARGVKDRLTVNGEIERLHTDMQSKWESLKEQMKHLDALLEEIQLDKKNQQLRDSISSLVSNDRSTIGSLETPGSSPASSIVMSSFVGELSTPTNNSKLRASRLSRLPQANGRRSVSLSETPNQSTRRTPTTRMSLYGSPARGSSTSPAPGRSPSAMAASRLSTATPTRRPPLDGRPRWNSSTNTHDGVIGHNFKPHSLTSPSGSSRPAPPATHVTRHYTSPSAGESRLPLRSPLAPDSLSPSIAERTPSRASKSYLSFRERVASPAPSSQQSLTMGRPSTLSKKMSTPSLGNRRSSLQPAVTSDSSPIARSTRPASSLASTRRVSMLPQPRERVETSTGRESRQSLTGQRAENKAGKEKPRWRH